MPSFADVVDKVKPAVISVRVKVDGAKMMSFDGNSPFPPSSPMERFFRRFGMPFGNDAPDSQRQPHDHPMTGQGSGFFITGRHAPHQASRISASVSSQPQEFAGGFVDFLLGRGARYRR